MTGHSSDIEKVPKGARTTREELLVFLVIVALVWPAMTVGVVGGYGFAGPPGPPKR
jgi:nitrate reductase NapE component